MLSSVGRLAIHPLLPLLRVAFRFRFAVSLFVSLSAPPRQRSTGRHAHAPHAPPHARAHLPRGTPPPPHLPRRPAPSLRPCCGARFPIKTPTPPPLVRYESALAIHGKCACAHQISWQVSKCHTTAPSGHQPEHPQNPPKSTQKPPKSTKKPPKSTKTAAKCPKKAAKQPRPVPKFTVLITHPPPGVSGGDKLEDAHQIDSLPPRGVGVRHHPFMVFHGILHP